MNPKFSLSDLKQKTHVEERLKLIAGQLIAAHRHQNHRLVVPYAKQAGLFAEGESLRRLFAKTIQVFHPDRLSTLWDRIERAHATGDSHILEEIIILLEYHPDGSGRIVVDDEQQQYGYDDEDFGYDIDPESEQDDEGEDEFPDGDEDEGTFYSAVRRELFGNLDLYPNALDLGRLEGELDLSDYDINDLGGIEHCQGLTAINLSGNVIDNVFPLGALTKLEFLDVSENELENADSLGSLWQLKELDLSSNDIEDFDFLDRLLSLKYVDLTGNPVQDKRVVERLVRRGVVVIY